MFGKAGLFLLVKRFVKIYLHELASLQCRMFIQCLYKKYK